MPNAPLASTPGKEIHPLILSMLAIYDIQVNRENRYQQYVYPRGLRAEPDILVSIHGSFPGSIPHFQNPENILDELYERLHCSCGSDIITCKLYSHATS